MNNLQKCELEGRIKYLWRKIQDYTKQLYQLDDAGEPYTSPRIIQLSNCITSYEMELMRLDIQYEDLIRAHRLRSRSCTTS